MSFEQPPQEPSPEQNIEKDIEGLLGTLYDKFAGAEQFDALSPELQEEWYLVEREAIVGMDREVGKAKLEAFIKKLESLESPEN